MADVVSLVATTPQAIIPVNGTAQLVLTATLDDDTTVDVAGTADSWSTSNSNVATVSATGLVTGVSSLGQGLLSVNLTGTYTDPETSTVWTASVSVAIQRQTAGFSSVDVQNLTAYTAQSLGFWANSLMLVNRAGFAVDVSFDGVNKAFGLGASGSQTSAVSWDSNDIGQIHKVYLKRVTGSGGGAAYVDVISAAR